jgi:hypothetical protein
MNFDPYNSELCLAHNAPVRLMSARGVRIICTAGSVWLTVEGEAGDVFLAAGESHLIRGRGLALLEAIGSGRVRFQKAARPFRSLIQALSLSRLKGSSRLGVSCHDASCSRMTLRLTPAADL